MRVLVPTESQMGLAGFVQASTTTWRLVAQEMVNPNRLVGAPKLEPLFRINGFGRNHSAVPSVLNEGPQPKVPGR